jgi:YfiH family protein
MKATRFEVVPWLPRQPKSGEIQGRPVLAGPRGWVMMAVDTAPGIMRWPQLEEAGPFLAAFTTRRGGTSPALGGDLNLAFGLGDPPGAVLANRELVAGALGIALEMMVLGEQCHGNRCQVVEEKLRGAGASSDAPALPGVDALVTDVPGLVLAGCFADCVPVYIVDGEHGAVGLAHAGWRGTAGRVAQVTFETMRLRYGSRGSRCVALVGPAIGPCCYQVGEDVAAGFRDHEYWPEVATGGPAGRWWLDLAGANRRQLAQLGIAAIHQAGLCTSCHSQFFSHRRDHGRSGRMMALLGVRAGAGKTSGGNE